METCFHVEHLAPPAPPIHVASTVAPSGAHAAAPASSVSPRRGATADPSVVHLTDAVAVKQNMFTSRPGYAHSMTNMQTHLHVTA